MISQLTESEIKAKTPNITLPVGKGGEASQENDRSKVTILRPNETKTIKGKGKGKGKGKDPVKVVFERPTYQMTPALETLVHQGAY